MESLAHTSAQCEKIISGKLLIFLTVPDANWEFGSWEIFSMGTNGSCQKNIFNLGQLLPYGDIVINENTNDKASIDI
jgi:hypothetical protein